MNKVDFCSPSLNCLPREISVLFCCLVKVKQHNLYPECPRTIVAGSVLQWCWRDFRKEQKQHFSPSFERFPICPIVSNFPLIQFLLLTYFFPHSQGSCFFHMKLLKVLQNLVQLSNSKENIKNNFAFQRGKNCSPKNILNINPLAGWVVGNLWICVETFHVKTVHEAYCCR